MREDDKQPLGQPGKPARFAGPSRREFLATGLPLAAATLMAGVTATTALAATGVSVPLAAVPTLAALRALARPTEPLSVTVLGFHAPGDGGGGAFFFDAAFQPAATNAPDDGGTYLLPTAAAPTDAGRWRRLVSGPHDPRWFGARGDNSGRTPLEDGADISHMAWNVWPTWSNHRDFGRAHLGLTSARPFQNADSWDSIGLQLALMSIGPGSGQVSVPAGTYQLTHGLFYISQMHATLSGAGMYQTILTPKPGHFTGNVLLDLYRVGGVPTVVRDLCLSGTSSSATPPFTLIRQIVTNGVHIENCWLTVCGVGIAYVDHSGDSFVRGCTAEYCRTALTLDATSQVVAEGNNFWQSAPPGERHTGIRSAGILYALSNRFIGLENFAIYSTGVLQAVGNHCEATTIANGAIYADGPGTLLNGNRIVGSSVSALVDVGSAAGGATISGNHIEQTGNHACLNLRQGSTHGNVTGNTLWCRPETSIAEGGLLISVQQGANYTSGCSGCLIANNVTNHKTGIIVDAARNTIVNNLNG